MTKHDTWVTLKPRSPYEPILDLFPDGIPMRDPFPMELSQDGKASLWIIDLERLSNIQTLALAQLIGSHHGVGSDEVVEEAIHKGGFAMGYGWVKSIYCGPEGFQRQKELADFLETHQPPSRQAWAEFSNSQVSRWIVGSEEPPPINNIDDVDPRLRTRELEQALKMRVIERGLAAGNYSVLDVLTGKAVVEVLNLIDPEHLYRVSRKKASEDDDTYE
jgi:hypothetical protein